MKTRRWNRALLLSLAVSAGLIALSFLLIDFSYAANDDLGMMSILNGSYSGTPDGHAIYLKYPLSWLIALLYRTGIPISWYQVVMTLAFFLAVASLCYRLLRRLPRHPVIACLLPVSGVALFWLGNLMSFTFSTCAAFLAAALVLCYALQTPEEDLRPGYLASILALLFLAYSIRDFCGYAAIPFLGVIWLAKYGRTMFRQPRCWLVPLSALLVLGAVVGIHKAAYRGWEDFNQYNLDRVYLQDYNNFPGYDDHEELITSLGYDRAAYFTLSHYDYSLLPAFDPEDIQTLSAYAKAQEPETSLASVAKTSLKRAIDYYFVDSLGDLHSLQAASYLLPALLLVLSVILSLRDRRWYILFSGLLLLGIGCCYLFIGYRGRYPTRVATTLRILVIGCSLAGLALLLLAHPLSVKREALRRPLTVCITVVLAAVTLWGFAAARSDLGAPHQAQMEYLSYIVQYPDNIYIRDTRSTQYDKKLLTEYPKVSPNVIATGAWSSYSPLYYGKLDYMGLEELNRDTLFLDNAYLIVRDKYDLHQVLGVSSDTVVDYEVVKSFEDGIQILKIYDIQD